MISVVIATLNDERTLGRTLAALVPAVVDGLVREVILVDGGSTDRTLEIAEDAGVRVLAAEGSSDRRVGRGCAIARSDWVIVLNLEQPLAGGWAAAVDDHLRRHPDQAAWWASGGSGLFAKPQGVLTPKRFAEASGKQGRRIRPKG